MRDRLGEEARFAHIREAISYIAAFTADKTEQDIYDEPMMRFAVIKQLEIIGEAANHITPGTKARMNQVEW